MSHLHPAFRWTDPTALAAFARDIGFAQIAVAGEDGPCFAHAPALVMPDGAVQLHLARSHPAAAAIDGARIALAFVGDHFYVSPDWYAAADQVPTWNYRLVEAHGRARRLDAAELADQVAALSLAFEARLAPKPVWTVDKMSVPRRQAMLRAIVGFAIDRPDWHGIAKLGQNKPAADRAGVAAALRRAGQPGRAALMEPAA